MGGQTDNRAAMAMISLEVTTKSAPEPPGWRMSVHHQYVVSPWRGSDSIQRAPWRVECATLKTVKVLPTHWSQALGSGLVPTSVTMVDR